MTKTYKYQYGLSETHADSLYDIKRREQKARKVISVLDDYYSGELNKLSLLDIGCSTGIMSNILCKRFDGVVGIDIDEPAVKHAKENYRSDNLQFNIQDAMNIKFPDKSFDVIICSQIYEHVPDYNQLMREIYRLLKPNGVCFFASVNRLNIIEGHYKLPFLSVIPKPLGHLYLQILSKGKYYYENHLTYWELKRLVSQFEIIDYTSAVVNNPEKYSATEMIRPDSIKQKIAKLVIKTAYWAFPTYIWLLRKG